MGLLLGSLSWMHWRQPRTEQTLPGGPQSLGDAQPLPLLPKAHCRRVALVPMDGGQSRLLLGALTQPEATVGPEEGTWLGAGCVSPVHTRLGDEQAGVPMVTGDSGQQAGQVWEGGLLEPLDRCHSAGTALERWTQRALLPASPLPTSPRPPGPAACLGHPGTAEEALASVPSGWVQPQTWPHLRRSHGPSARCSPVRG